MAQFAKPFTTKATKAHEGKRPKALAILGILGGSALVACIAKLSHYRYADSRVTSHWARVTGHGAAGSVELMIVAVRETEPEVTSRRCCSRFDDGKGKTMRPRLASGIYNRGGNRSAGYEF